MALPSHSDEQRQVIEQLRLGRCVSLSALAGTGKTTTALQVVQALQINTVILTYNRFLSDDCNERIHKFNIKNCVAFTYHGFISKCSATLCNNDTALLELVRKWENGIDVPARYQHSLFIIDEIQDMKPSFYEALRFLFPLDIQMMVVGDENQLLYDYQIDDAATPIFLQHSSQHFGMFTGDRAWINLQLTVSYRMTPNIAAFCNVIWGTNIVGANHSCPNYPVEYWHIDAFASAFQDRTAEFIDTYGIENVMILNSISPISGDSGKSKRPLEHHINKLLQRQSACGKRKYNVHVKESVRGNEGSSDWNEKLRVWTFCASKGMETKVTICFGIEVYNGRVTAKNQVGVGCSRASEKLIIVHGKGRSGALPYYPPLNSTILQRLVDSGIVTLIDSLPEDVESIEQLEMGTLYTTDVTHVSAFTVDRLLQFGKQECIREASAPISVNNIVKFHTGLNATLENVSAIYGEAIVYPVQYQRIGSIPNISSILNPILVSNLGNYSLQEVKNMIDAARGTYDDRYLKKLRSEFIRIVQRKQYVEPKIRGKDVMLLFKKYPPIREGITGSYHVIGVGERSRYDEIFTDMHLTNIQFVYEKPDKSAHEYMYLANASLAFSGTHELFTQVGTDVSAYESWVESEQFWTAVHALDQMLPDRCEFEQLLCSSFDPVVYGSRRCYDSFAGKLDVLCRKQAYEIKCVEALTSEHKLQALLYAALLVTNRIVTQKATSFLMNAKTGEIWKFYITAENARQLIRNAAEAKSF